ncbi:MAG: amidohydrolase family protein [Candidatus Lokiarchaeota archaeon]|nr:amidohydrolase family protein [Candidatus Lokiarchaeota archaeon]
MFKTAIHSNYGLIGDELEIKKNILIEIDKNGKIATLSYDNIRDDISFSVKQHTSLLIPGLVNSHIHICDSFAKEQGFNKDLIEVVAPPNGIKHKLLESISKEVKMHGIREAVSDMLASGITLFVDFTENGLTGINLLKEALESSPINYRILGRYKNPGGMESILKNADGLGFASYDQLSSQYKEKMHVLKKEYFGKIIACHDAELSRDELMFNKIIKDELIDVIIHGTHYTIEDLKRIKENNISLVLCPGCNGYFGCGFPPINDIYNLEIPISLGTDNVMANNINLFEEMRYLYRISRVLATEHDDSKISSKDLLKMVSINGAKNVGLDKEFGSISEGKFADFSLINLSDPNYYTYNINSESIYNIIVQRTKAENIKKTYIRGEVEYERK